MRSSIRSGGSALVALSLVDLGSGVALTAGDDVEVLTWLSSAGEECIGIMPDGNPTLRPDRRYLGAIFFDHAEYSLYPGTAAELDDADALALRAELLDGLDRPADDGARMAAATPDPLVAEQMSLDPSARLEALSAVRAELDPPPATDVTGNTFPS